jgi:hypothetical protein
MLFGLQWYWLLLAALVYFAVGAAWYSPLLFAKPWMKELPKKPNMDNATTAMLITFASMVVLVAAEAYIISLTATSGWENGAKLGAVLWAGFTATTALINASFQGTSPRLYAIDQGYHLVGMVLAGAILAH